MLTAYAVVFCLAFTVAVLAAPVVRFLATRIGAVDHPDGKRKIHSKPMPRLGGLVISGALGISVIACIAITPGLSSEMVRSYGQAAGFAAGLLVILGLGITDDIKGVKPRTKILFQTVAVVLCWWAGLRVEVPFVEKGTFLWMSLPLTWFWLVACINAINLVDGMDGLASGVAFFVGLVIFILAALYAKTAVALVAAALLGSVVGFLMYNFHPAVMFLGDSGSMLLGYLIAVLAMAGSMRSHATAAFLIPILALGLPIMDTLLAILRRWSRRLPISQADREHVHHKLLAMGFSHREAVVVLYSACTVLAGMALAMAFAGSRAVGVVLAVVAVAAVVAVRFVGAGEIAAFMRRLGETLRASGSEEILAARKRTRFLLKHAQTWEDIGKALEPFLKAAGADAAAIHAAAPSGRVLVAMGTPAVPGAGFSREEVFDLATGDRVVMVVRSAQPADFELPDDLRRVLTEAMAGIERQSRIQGLGARSPLDEGWVVP